MFRDAPKRLESAGHPQKDAVYTADAAGIPHRRACTDARCGCGRGGRDGEQQLPRACISTCLRAARFRKLSLFASGDHAVYHRVDHHEPADNGAAPAGAAEQAGPGRPQKDREHHAVCCGGAGAGAGDRCVGDVRDRKLYWTPGHR